MDDPQAPENLNPKSTRADYRSTLLRGIGLNNP